MGPFQSKEPEEEPVILANIATLEAEYHNRVHPNHALHISNNFYRDIVD